MLWTSTVSFQMQLFPRKSPVTGDINRGEKKLLFREKEGLERGQEQAALTPLEKQQEAGKNCKDKSGLWKERGVSKGQL